MMKRETIRTILVTVIVIIAIVWSVRFFVVEPYRVPPGQMENSLLPGDRLWVDKWSFRWGHRTPARRDLLSSHCPRYTSRRVPATRWPWPAA